MKPTLLLVALDDVRRAQIGVVGVTSRIPKRAALAEQVPGLIERDFERIEPLTVFVGRGACGLALPELMLLSNELVDAVVDLPVVHSGGA